MATFEFFLNASPPSHTSARSQRWRARRRSSFSKYPEPEILRSASFCRPKILGANLPTGPTMTVPAANEGGVVVILAIGSQANARAGPEDRNLVEKVVMVLHRSEISNAAQTGRQAFHPGCHEIKSLSIFGWQIALQCGMIPQSPGTWLSLVLWVQTLLISSDDRRVSGFLLFHLRLRPHSTDPQHYQLQSSKNGRRKMPTCTVILPCLSCLGLLITHFRQEFLVRIWNSTLFRSATNAALRRLHPSLPNRLCFTISANE
jgi:hypothetical protein